MPPGHTLGRGRRLLLLAAAAALAGAGGVLVTAAPAQAISPCMGPVPPPDCPPPGGGRDPIQLGAITSATRTPGGVKVNGWVRAILGTAPTVTVTIGGAAAGTITPQPPATGTTQADFSGTVPATHEGTVCATTGTSTSSLGCSDLSVSFAPFGHLDSVSIPGDGYVHLTGWAIDPDTTAAVYMRVVRTGPSITPPDVVKRVLHTYADSSRPDVGDAYPGWGDDHGFVITMPEGADGDHTICVYADNSGPGSGKVQLGTCHDYTVKHNPFGSLDQAKRSGTSVAVAGWAIDPDQPTSPVDVKITDDGTTVATVTADGSRPDVGDAYPGTGDNHGFTTTIPAIPTAGNHTVCAIPVSLGLGTGKSIGCGTYSTPAAVTAPTLTAFTSSWPWAQAYDTPHLRAESATIYWTDSSTTVDHYRLERSDAGGAWHVIDDPIRQLHWSDDGLSPDSSYCWRVVSVNDFSSATSDPLCATTPKAHLPYPTDITTSATDTTATLSWTDNATNEDHYLVGISRSPHSLDGVTWYDIAAGSGTMSYTFTGLTPGVQYYVEAWPLRQGYEGWVTGVNFAVRTSGPPKIDSFAASPTVIQACVPQQVKLTWQTDDATHVVVKAGSTVLADRTQTDPDTWSDSVLAPATDGNQTYTITAYSPDGRSTSTSVTVSRGSVYPLIHSLMFSNTGWNTVEVVRLDAVGNIIQNYGTIAPGYTKVLTLKNCEVDRIAVIDTVNQTWVWDSNGWILGYDQGANPGYGI